MPQFIKIDEIKYVNFSDLDRETPVLEVWYKEKPILGIIKENDAFDNKGDFVFCFSETINDYQISFELIQEIMHEAKKFFDQESYKHIL